MDPNMNQQGMPMQPMQQPQQPMRLEVSVGAVLSKSFDYLKENIGMYLALYLIPLVPFVLGGVIAGAMTSSSTDISATGSALMILFVTTIVGAVISIRAQASIVAASLRIIANGEKPSFSQAWAMGKPHFGRTFTTGLLQGLIIVVGFLLLIVPGIIFMSWYFVAVAAAIDNNIGASAALSESKRLTAGKIGTIVGLVLALMGISIVLSMLPIIGQFASMLVSLLSAIFAPYLYVALKQEKGTLPANMGMPGAMPQQPAQGMPMQQPMAQPGMPAAQAAAPEAPQDNSQTPPPPPPAA
jgi:hypothetical protein